jgi:hypothetical protein
VAALFALGAGAYTFVLTVDPYGSGLLTLIDRIVTTDVGRRLDHASRARNAAFDSAIIGNSTAQLLQPERLGALTGGRYINLTMGGIGPVEQMTMIDYFHRHHPQGINTLIVGMDAMWCHGDRYFARTRILHSFPFWLYDGDRLAYLSHIMSFPALHLSAWKLRVWLGLRQPGRADGYDDFEEGRMWQIDPGWTRSGPDQRLFERDAGDGFAALDALEQRVARLDPSTRVVFAFMPQYAGGLPPPDSVGGRRLQACKDRARQAAASGHRAAFLDLMQDGPLTRNAENFWDTLHYRGHVARQIEDEIAYALSKR